MHEDFEACVRAVQSKDARFDGWFFTCVTTTRIYCRPSCPVPPPKREHMRFVATAAAAHQAGFRACKRCRPDASPGSPEWNVRADVVGRAMQLIADGVVDREGVPGLAQRLGYSVRQLQRQMVHELGAPPLAIARAQRAQTARVLIQTTTLPFADIAFAAGFASIRQFNDTVRTVFAMTPTELRRRTRTPAAAAAGPGAIQLRLPVRLPFHPEGVFAHLVATAVPGVEAWLDGTYHRALRLPHGHGIASLTPSPEAVHCSLRLEDLRDLTAAVARCRWLLDLDADPVAIDELLSTDGDLAPLVDKTPGRRVPRTTDGAELAIRVVIGQQISTGAGRTHSARLVQRYGEPLSLPHPTLTHLFPAPETLVDLDPAVAAMPARRRQTIEALAGEIAEGRLALDPSADRHSVREALMRLPGIGPWTTEVVAMRALGDPNAFPLLDLGVKTAAGLLGIEPKDLPARAEAWRPWRAYATQYLWGLVPHAINRLL